MSADAMDSGWYYSKRGGPPGQQFGPVTWENLVSYARGGLLAPEDLVWNEQLPDWRPASQIPGLFPASAPASPAMPAAYAAAPGYVAAQPKKSTLLYWLIPVVVLVLVGAGLGAYFGFWYNKDGSEFAQQGGEILLEPSGVAGPDSFAGEQFVATGPTTTFKIPNPQVTLPPVTTTANATSTTQAASTTTASTSIPPTVLVAYPGDTPALYGGSKDKLIADKEGELAFLEANPNKAAAFCEALNSDPTLRWSGGNKVRPDQLRAYFAELTPMLLTRDIRVTNYGYKNGHPTPRQSVLQAGQLILVDRYGVPRKRCECGNPLTPPIPTYKPPVYIGPEWPGFDPTTIIVIQQTTVIIDIFVVIDINTGEPFGRPAGTNGGSDGPPPEQGSGETTTTEVPPSTETTAPPSTGTTSTETTSTTTGGGGPIDPSELNGTWSGTMTITEINIPSDVAQTAAEQGCDPALLEALKGQPLPMEMTITVDPGGASGTAVMNIDASALGGGTTGEPTTLSFTISGDTLIFDMEAGAGATGSMTGTVSRQGQTLVINGVMTSEGDGASIKAEWQVTKQIAM